MNRNHETWGDVDEAGPALMHLDQDACTAYFSSLHPAGADARAQAAAAQLAAAGSTLTARFHPHLPNLVSGHRRLVVQYEPR